MREQRLAAFFISACTCVCIALPASLAQEQKLTGHEHEVMAVAFHRDGKLLASVGVDGTLQFWSLPDGKSLKSIEAHPGGAYAAVFSPDGGKLFTAGADKLIRVWRNDGREIAKLEGHKDKVAALAVSADGKQVASGSYDGTIRIWDVASGKVQWSMRVYEKSGIVSSLAFSQDGKMLASGGATDDVIIINTNLISEGAADVLRLWSVENGKLIRKLPIRAAHVAFSPDGKTVAAGAHINEVEETRSGGHAINGADIFTLVDLDGREKFKRRLHGEGVAFSADGKWLVTGHGSSRHEAHFGIMSGPGYREEFAQLRLWDIATGKEVLRILDDDATTFALSPDGKTLASGNHDGVITLRDVPTALKNPFPDFPEPGVPEKYAALVQELNARFEELLKSEKDPQPLRDAQRKFRRTYANSGGMWYYTEALRILRQTRSPAGVPLLVRFALTLDAADRFGPPEYFDSLAILTGLEVPDKQPDKLPAWWQKNRDKIETNLDRMSADRLRMVAERLISMTNGSLARRQSFDRSEPQAVRTLEAMRSVLNWRDEDSRWYPQDLHRGMLPMFLAKAGYREKPPEGNAALAGEVLLDQIPILTDLARKEPAAVQTIADDARQTIGVRLTCLFALQRAGKDQTNTLLALLKDEKDQDRRIMLTLSLALGDKTAAPVLIKLLDDEDEYIRRSAVKALNRHRAAAALPGLKKLLEDPQSGVDRRDLYRVIANIGTREAQSILAEALRKEVERARGRYDVYDALATFEAATGKKWMKGDPRLEEDYRETAKTALEWWDSHGKKP